MLFLAGKAQAPELRLQHQTRTTSPSTNAATPGLDTGSINSHRDPVVAGVYGGIRMQVTGAPEDATAERGPGCAASGSPNDGSKQLQPAPCRLPRRRRRHPRSVSVTQEKKTTLRFLRHLHQRIGLAADRRCRLRRPAWLQPDRGARAAATRVRPSPPPAVDTTVSTADSWGSQRHPFGTRPSSPRRPQFRDPRRRCSEAPARRSTRRATFLTDPFQQTSCRPAVDEANFYGLHQPLRPAGPGRPVRSVPLRRHRNSPKKKNRIAGERNRNPRRRHPRRLAVGKPEAGETGGERPT